MASRWLGPMFPPAVPVTRPMTQRELVALSLLVAPERAGKGHDNRTDAYGQKDSTR